MKGKLLREKGKEKRKGEEDTEGNEKRTNRANEKQRERNSPIPVFQQK